MEKDPHTPVGYHTFLDLVELLVELQGFKHERELSRNAAFERQRYPFSSSSTWRIINETQHESSVLGKDKTWE